MDETGPALKKPSVDAERERLMEAMLLLVGEVGYRRATLAGLMARSGVGRGRFYALFAGKEECFAAAHAAELERLCDALLAAAAGEPDRPAALRAVTSALVAYIAAKPLTARAVLREVYVAEGAALAAHEEALERLSGALQAGACRETAGPRHSPPPMSAAFMVGAVEEIVRACLAAERPERELRARSPELIRLLAGPFPRSRA